MTGVALQKAWNWKTNSIFLIFFFSLVVHRSVKNKQQYLQRRRNNRQELSTSWKTCKETWQNEDSVQICWKGTKRQADSDRTAQFMENMKQVKLNRHEFPYRTTPFNRERHALLNKKLFQSFRIALFFVIFAQSHITTTNKNVYSNKISTRWA